MARERRSVERFKPTNFKAPVLKAPKALKAPTQPTNIVQPVRPIAVQRASPADVPVLAIPIAGPAQPVRQQKKPVNKEASTVGKTFSYSKNSETLRTTRILRW